MRFFEKIMPGKKRIFLWIVSGLALIGGAVVIYTLLSLERDAAEMFSLLKKEKGIEKPNLILITLDTIRADRLPAYGYSGVRTPHLDTLASQGVVFEQCASSSPLTLPSHSTIMTGLYPTYHGVRVNGNTALSEQHTTLAELFKRHGYRCGAFIGAFVLDGRWGLHQGFHFYDDRFDLKKYKQLDLGLVQRPGNEVVDSALDWLEAEKDNRFFAWIHLYDPHIPYEPPEPYFSEYNTGLSGLYDGEIAFMDEQIGRIPAWLEKNGLASDTLVVVVGDHGEGLGSHGELTHGYFIYDYAVWVPFFIVTPFEKLQGIRIPSQVELVDVYSTVLEMAGIPVPGENQGESLLDLLFEPEKRKHSYAYGESLSPNIHYGWAPLYSLRTPKFKYIEAPRPELYGLSKDPGETVNVIKDHPKQAREFQTQLKRIIEETSSEAPKPEAANLDSATLQRLAALGYIGAPVARKPSPEGNQSLADPKDKIHIFESIQQAGEWINREEYEKGVRILESVLEEEADIPQAVLLLATSYVELGRTEEARRQYDLILKEDPQSVQALIGMANLLLKEGEKEDVIALCKQVLSVDERNTQAYTIIGEIYMEEEDHLQARPYLEKAVEIQPKLARNRLNLAVCLMGLKYYEQAESHFQGILKEYPKFPMVHFHLGLLYEEQSRLDDAVKAYSDEVNLYPDHFRARFNMGKLLLKKGDREGYTAQMREVIRYAPDEAEGYLFLARGMLLESQDENRILELIQKGLSLTEAPELKALGYFLLADVYSRKNQPEKVAEALKKANSYKTNKTN